MYTRCLLCSTPFPPNGKLRALSRAAGVAYDLRRGRLWQICSGCKRWSLVPLEARWEALEELEALVASGGRARGSPGVRSRAGSRSAVRILASTDHIALYGIGDLRIVRVGPAELSEEAWWRFGEPLDQAVAGAPRPRRRSRKRGEGGLAWRGEEACSGCGHLFRELTFADRKILVVEAPEDAGDGTPSPPRLFLRCPRCRDAHRGGLRLTGTQAELALARILAFEDLAGASLDRVRAATRLAQDPDGPGTLVRILTRFGHTLVDIPPVGILALEITLMAAREARLLRLEAEDLQFRWRQEEELAALVDGELTPTPLLGSLIRKVRGKE